MFAVAENMNGNLRVIPVSKALDATRDGWLIWPGAFKTMASANQSIRDFDNDHTMHPDFDDSFDMD